MLFFSIDVAKRQYVLPKLNSITSFLDTVPIWSDDSCPIVIFLGLIALMRNSFWIQSQNPIHHNLWKDSRLSACCNSVFETLIRMDSSWKWGNQILNDYWIGEWSHNAEKIFKFREFPKALGLSPLYKEFGLFPIAELKNYWSLLSKINDLEKSWKCLRIVLRSTIHFFVNQNPKAWIISTSRFYGPALSIKNKFKKPTSVSASILFNESHHFCSNLSSNGN